MTSRIRHVVAAALLATAVVALAAKKFEMPRAYNAKTYPARDEHKQEQVTIAADPYDTADRQDIFSSDYREHGILPVLLIVSNDGDQPVSLANMKIEMITSMRDKLPAATMDDVIRRIQKEVKRPDAPRTYPLPIPRKVKPTVEQKTRDEIDESMFHAKAVEAHTTRSGFVYFDVSGISNPLAGARLTCSGLTNGNGQELFFFEIYMEKYLTYQPGKTP